MNKKRRFLKTVGILKALVPLAFVMAFAIACDTGTSNGGSNKPSTEEDDSEDEDSEDDDSIPNPGGPQPGNPQPGGMVPQEDYDDVRRESDLLAAIANATPVIYVHSDVKLNHPATLKSGQRIVVGGDSGSNTNIIKSQGGPLFEVATSTSSLTIGSKLTLERGSSLTIAKGATVNVQTPSAGREGVEGTLHVAAGASVGVGVNVSGAESLGTLTGASSLNVQSRATLYFEKDAVLAITDNPAASKVKQATKDGVVTLVGVKLAVVSESGIPSVINVIGDSSKGHNVVIDIPEGADASIGDVTVYTDAAANFPAIDEVNAAIKAAVNMAVSKNSSQTTNDPDDIEILFDDTAINDGKGATKVTYTGTEAISLGVSPVVPAGKTLVIAGATSGPSGAITVGTLEIAATGRLTTSGTIGVTTLTNEGELEASAAISATGTLTNNGTLNAGAAITVGTLNNIPTTVAGSGTITITAGSATVLDVKTALVNEGTINLGANGTIAGAVGATPTFTNRGLIKSARDILAAELGTFLAKVKGKIELSGGITVDADTALTIPTGTTLTIASGGKLTVAAGISPLGSVTIASGGTLVSASGSTGLLHGDLVVENGGVYKDLNTHGATLWLNGGSQPLGNGIMTWNAGAKGYVGGEAASDLRIGGPNDAAILKLASGGVLKNTRTGYELTGNATVGRYGLDKGLVFTIKENSIFTVDVPASFAPEQGIVITDDGCKIVGTNNTSQIRILTGNAIYFWFDSAKNFYDSNGAQIKSPIPAGNYAWETNAGGATTPGWKALAGANTTVDPKQETADPNKVIEYLAGTVVTEITYTGTAAIPGTTSVAGKTLVIKNTIAGQNAAINVTELIINDTGKLTATAPIAVGTLTINGGGTLTTSGANGSISATTLTNSGVLKTEAAVTTTGTLTIDGGTLTSTATGTAISAATLTNSGVLTASGSISATTLTNSGVLTSSGSTGVVISAATLTNSGLLTASGSISATTLEITSGSLTTNGANAVIIAPTLTNSGVLTAGAPINAATSLTNSNTITTTAAINAGSLTITAGSLTTTASGTAITAPTLINSGVLTAESGAINAATSLTNNATTGIINLGTGGTIPTGGTKTNSGTINTATLDENKLDAILGVGGSITATGSAIAPADGLTIPAGTHLTLDGGTLTIADTEKLIINGTGTLTNNGTITLVGTIEGAGTYNAGSGTFEVSNTAALNSAVAFNVPEIKLNAAFYEGANAGNAIAIGYGAARAGPAITINGDGTSTLEVGVLIANNYITLHDVDFSVTNSAKATITNWNPGYTAAISIGRSTNGTALETGENQPANNVTVEDCDITISGNAGFTAGIFINGGSAWDSTGSGADVFYPSKNITISGNTITATGSGGSAVQGLYIGLYDYSVKVTGNTITARYQTDRTGLRVGSPASAIFISSLFGESGSGTPEISGNHLNGDDATTANTAYSFYINAFQTRNPTVLASHSGVDVLRGGNFALYETAWALSAGETASSYKQVFNALLANITGTGFGSISIPYSASAFEYEHYNISNGKVTAISVLGDHLTDGKYVGTDNVANKFGTEGGAPNGVDYGSFAVSEGVLSGAKTGLFYFTYDTQDTDHHYNN
jgi:hypothetical protein